MIWQACHHRKNHPFICIKHLWFKLWICMKYVPSSVLKILFLWLNVILWDLLQLWLMLTPFENIFSYVTYCGPWIFTATCFSAKSLLNEYLHNYYSLPYYTHIYGNRIGCLGGSMVSYIWRAWRHWDCTVSSRLKLFTFKFTLRFYFRNKQLFGAIFRMVQSDKK